MRSDEGLSPDAFRRAVEAAPNPYLILRPDPPRFTIVAASGAYLRATKTRREEIVGRDLFQIFPDDPEDHGATGTINLRASLERVLATRAPDRMPVQRYPIRRPAAEGGGFEERYWRPQNVPVLDGDGRVELIVHHVEDVTEFVLMRGHAEAMAEEVGRANGELGTAEEALRTERERLRLIFESATEYAIFATDLDRRVTSWNAGAERLLGWTEREIVGRSADAIFTPEDRGAGVPEREARKALAEGRAENERWHLRQDGTRFWASGLTMPLRDPAAGPDTPPLGLLAVMRDQTDGQRAEERRALLANELNHRVKNTLVVVQALTRLGTRSGSPDLSTFAAAFQRRILALARAHDLLTREDWTGAPLGGVMRAGLASLMVDGARIDLSACEAPDVFLPPGAALTLAMAVHELATNAVRHGALSTSGGRVRVACLALGGNGDGVPRHVVEWVERGGPPIPGPPTRRGFGLRLLERGLAMQAGMGADICFEPEGLRCTLRLPSPRPARSNRRVGNA